MRLLTVSTALIAATSLIPTAVAQVEFTASQRLALAAASERHYLLDLDGDGLLDLVSEHLAASPEANLGRGDGTFRSTALSLLPPAVYDLGAGDVDGDGDLDLVASASSLLTTYFNNGAGTFALGPQILAVPTAEPLRLADFDADGFLDVAMHPTNTSQIDLWFGNGTGTFGGRVTVTLPSAPQSFAALELGAAAPAEIAATHQDRSVSVISRTSGRNFSVASAATLTYPSRIEQVFDFDGNGSDDLILVGHRFDLAFAPFGVTVLASNGSGGFLPESLQHAGLDVVFTARAGSFDATGDADLLVGGQTQDLLYTRDARGTRRVELDFPSPAADTAIGDLDRDGDLDTLRLEGSAQIRVWENQARYELHLPFDETSGVEVWNAARGDASAESFRMLGNASWQGDPGPGREAFRSNDAGSGAIARGSNAFLSSAYGSGMPRAQMGSFTLAWWQRMGPQAPPQRVTLWEGAGVTCVTGDATAPDRLVVVAGLPFAPVALVSATPVHVPGRWMHVAITADVAQSVLRLWIDGVQDPGAVALPAGYAGPFGQLAFGAGVLGAQRATSEFDLDELRFVPRVLDGAEIGGLLRGNAITIAPMGDGCFERRPEEGLHMRGLLRPGGVVEVQLETTGVSGGVALLAFGISSTHLGAVSLPLDFGFGCAVRTSLDALAPMPIGRLAELSFPLPSAPGALQGHLYAQALIFGTGVQTTRAFDLKLRY